MGVIRQNGISKKQDFVEWVPAVNLKKIFSYLLDKIIEKNFKKMIETLCFLR